MRTSMEGSSTSLCIISLFSIFVISNAVDTITQTRSISDGETIVSSGGSFEMGFFSLGNSKNRYVGIWYKKIPVLTVVWVANREIPLYNTSGVLKVSATGVLTLLNGTNDIIWSSDASRPAQNPVAQLLDSGNLLLKNAIDDDPKNFLWQSFDYPGNTHLPGMKIGKNLITGQEWYLSSWKSDDDPAQGNFSYHVDTRGYPQFVLMNGFTVKYRSGPWNGQRPNGSPTLKSNIIFKWNSSVTKEGAYSSYVLLNSSIVSRRILSSDGYMERWAWNNQEHKWSRLDRGPPRDDCDYYASCGEYGSCNTNSNPICECLNKFVPKDLKNWQMGDWSGGCIRNKSLACHQGDGFLRYSGLKLPDARYSSYKENMTLKECGKMCLQNCTCMAYADVNITSGGTGCLLWFGKLIDIKELSEDGKDIYVRMASSELEEVAQVSSGAKRKKTIMVLLAVALGILLSISLSFYVWKKKRQQLNRRGKPLKQFILLIYSPTYSSLHSHVPLFEFIVFSSSAGMMGHISDHSYTERNEKEDLDLPLFDLATVVKATNKFSIDNKLGQGGFGPVYKGTLEGGQEIAVKRLSRDSTQGFDEFKNELVSIAKLQHRNLVRLLGCCIEGEENMLIYEYMPNKSLDFFIFEKHEGILLDWPKRLHIINGISRGLLYLHQDSRLRIVHRDLKASNILLDADMNPKISDFGMARIFGGNETMANTSRVVGTYGYMAPEYAVDGIFSIKSDVFSFGVLVLEIISGKKNRGFIHSDHHLNLLGHAWKLQKEGRTLELVNEMAVDSCCISEVLRCIHVALLCVQQCPEDRPSMSSVVLMLGGDGTLIQPKQPGFFTERSPVETEYSISKEAPSSVNEISMTLLDAR